MDTQMRANVSITRWLVATNDARAPNNADHAKVALELAAYGRSGAIPHAAGGLPAVEKPS